MKTPLDVESVQKGGLVLVFLDYCQARVFVFWSIEANKPRC